MWDANAPIFDVEWLLVRNEFVIETVESIEHDPIELLLVGDAITVEADVGDIPDRAGREEETVVLELDIDVILGIICDGEAGLALAESAATACCCCAAAT